MMNSLARLSAVICLYGLSFSTALAATLPVSNGIEVDVYETFEKNPTLENFRKLFPVDRFALITNAESELLLGEPISNKATAAIYSQAVQAISASERVNIDTDVLRKNWQNDSANEEKVDALMARLFGKNGSVPVGLDLAEFACDFAIQLANGSDDLIEMRETKHEALRSGEDYGPSLDKLFESDKNFTQAGFRRFEKVLKSQSLGSFQHASCDFEVNDVTTKKTLRELLTYTDNNLKKLPLAAFASSPVKITGANSVANPAQGKCTLTQIHDALVDGERVLRNGQADNKKPLRTSNHFSFSQGSCRFLGKLERESKTGSLKLELRPYAPGDASTIQEGKDLSTLVKNIFAWQEAPIVTAPTAAKTSSAAGKKSVNISH